MKIGSLLALALSLLYVPYTFASVTLGLSPFARSPHNTGGVGVSLSADRNESSYTLNWLTAELIGPASNSGAGIGEGDPDVVLSSALFFPVNESVRLGGRVGLASSLDVSDSSVFGAFGLRFHEKDSRFMYEVDLGVAGAGETYGKAMFGWNLFR